MNSVINRTGRKALILTAALLAGAVASQAAPWTALGPEGGDVRSLAYDPHNPDRVFLGNSTGGIFLSTDGGKNWSRFTHLGAGDDYVIDHIIVNPQDSNVIYASAWSVENQQAGDIFRSNDGGVTWTTLTAMHGKSVRTLAMSASDPTVLAAGALDGVYRSTDGGNNWSKVSPASNEVKNIESMAIDPKNPNTIYAGTWHLAWKTDDAGANWRHINKGMIDDSDVFSVIVDSSDPSIVFASACSGIYKSTSGGELFSKVQGIPFSARRTRVLKQDPSNASTVYAGTTEGLWKSTDLGKTWKQVTGPEVVVNDVMIDPRDSKHVLLATDRTGVLASDNGAQSFAASNHGYAHRYVTSILADKTEPGTILVGVVNDREWGGVFGSRDGGRHWTQKSKGLGGRDVFSLKQTASGELVAGTNRGIFSLAANASEWQPMNTVLTEKSQTKIVVKKGKKVKTTVQVPVKSTLEARVSELELTPSHWIAATSGGIYVSKNDGKSWTGGPVMGKSDFVAVRSKEDTIVAATRSEVLISKDDGATWKTTNLAGYVSGIRNVSLGSEGRIFVAAREGAFRTIDGGDNWQHIQNGLPDRNISSISFDAEGNRWIATSSATGVVFESADGGDTWRRGPDTGYPLRSVSLVHGHYMAATPFDGVIVEPENVSQSAAANGGQN